MVESRRKLRAGCRGLPGGTSLAELFGPEAASPALVSCRRAWPMRHISPSPPPIFAGDGCGEGPVATHLSLSPFAGEGRGEGPVATHLSLSLFAGEGRGEGAFVTS